jgi:hypothetical protein
MKASLALVALVTTQAAAEPCPMMNLVPEVMQALPSPQAEAQLTADGGLIIIEIPRAWDGGKKPSLDTSKWQVRAGGKLTKPALTAIAPGMWLVKPPAGATTYSIEDDTRKAKGRGRIVAKGPTPLPPPSIGMVTSGETTSKHITRFVRVDLTAKAPKGAIAMVLVDAKGAPMSWGLTWDGADTATVYSTQGGCVQQFPNGTQIAQPGDKVSAFWIDGAGRRSPASQPIIVSKPQ